MNKTAKIIIGVLAFALLLALASYGYKLLTDTERPQNEEAAQPAQTDTIAAPVFSVQDVDGDTVSLSDFKGKPVVVNFWASWCPPCKGEMPAFEEMYQKYSEQGVVFMMVNLTDGSRETVDTAKAFLEEEGYTFPAYFDVDYSAAYAYGISSIPVSVFVDKNGNIYNGYKGELDRKTIESNIVGILA